MKAIEHKRIIAIFQRQGFTLDFEGSGDIDAGDQELYDGFLADPYGSLFFYGFREAVDAVDSMKFLHSLSEMIIHKISRKEDIEFTRERTEIAFSDDETSGLASSVPFALGMEYVDQSWVRDIFLQLGAVFKNLISSYDGSVADFLADQKANVTVMGRVFFHLVENRGDDLPFAFLATYSKQSEKKEVSHIPLKSALLEFKGQTGKLIELLSTVNRAVSGSELISNLVESGEIFSPLKFTADDAYTFLKEIPLYEESGVVCRIPDWWKKRQTKAMVNVKIGEKGESRLGENAILSFNPEISLGGEVLSDEEINNLLNQAEGLRLIKGKWIEVDHARLKQALEALEKARKYASFGTVNMFDALRLEMDFSRLTGISDDGVVEVTNGEWLRSALEKLKKPEKLNAISAGDSFKCLLRHYQQAGLNWLSLMMEYGFGACLADDMGLGKTVQVIGLLEYLRISRKQENPSLLVVPASLIANWEAELARFAPKIKYQVLHGKIDTENLNINNETNLYITTYATLSKLDAVAGAKWELLILDEAQAIKNPGTKQTRAAKSIDAKSRIAMTGTPIENRLMDLWSLFDFLNAGLLGNVNEFKAFINKLESDSNNYRNLRAVISPFILRRLKTDKKIISDLPDKIEMKAYAALTRKQVALYKSVVDDIEEKLTNSEGIERKGLILASLMKLKQICNHPDHYLGQSGYDASHSGKFGVLEEICGTIYEKRERVLVFSQFREILEPLDRFLETIFGRKGLVMHGGTPVKKRQELVNAFQGKEYVPYMVLSLKVGGVGLNLTSANHIVHFDRWWNPAVENQATDRAFRIGQEKNVVVHKFITSNTIEERIDLMIEDKLKLSGDIITSSGENWITEMNDRELMRLFRMAGD